MSLGGRENRFGEQHLTMLGMTVLFKGTNFLHKRILKQISYLIWYSTKEKPFAPVLEKNRRRWIPTEIILFRVLGEISENFKDKFGTRRLT